VEEFRRLSKISYFSFRSRVPTSRNDALDIVAPTVEGWALILPMPLAKSVKFISLVPAPPKNQRREET
jgi:hypothetical protein